MEDYPFDFAVRLDALIIGCLKGGDKPEALQDVLRNALKDLTSAEAKFLLDT